MANEIDKAFDALKHVTIDLEMLYEGDWKPAEKDSSILASLDNVKLAREFLVKYTGLIETAYEIAFGDDAMERDFTNREVLDRLRTFSDQSHFLEETASPMLKTIHQEGGEDWWEADLDETVEQLDKLGV